MALGPDNVFVAARFTRFLLRHGRASEGALHAQATYRLAPHMPQVRHLLCAALLVDGQILKGLRTALSRTGLPLSLLLDALRALAWRPQEPGWRLRVLPIPADRLRLHLGAPDEVRSADIPYRRSSSRAVMEPASRRADG